MERQRGSIFLPILIILLLLGIVGYFIFQNNLTKEPTELSGSARSEEWNTYTNERWDFQFNHPGDIIVKKTITDEDYGSMGGDFGFMVNDVSLVDCEGKGCPKWIGVEIFNDLSFTKYEFYNDDPGGAEVFTPSFTVDYEYQLNDNTFVYLSGSYPYNNQSKKQEVLKTLDEILSTFIVSKQ